MFFNYYDDTGLLIGSTQEIGFINPKRGADESFKIIGSWGTQDPTVWLKDNYRVEVVFMDTVVGIIPFSVGDELKTRYNDKEALINDRLKDLYHLKETDSELNYDYVANNDEEPPIKINPEEVVLAKPILEEKEIQDETIQQSLEEALNELNSLIGLNEVKTKINDYIDYVKYLQLRSKQGIDDNKNIKLHSVFTGNPGTGKTTVVKLLGNIYKSLGLLSKGHVVTVDSNDLVSGYVRQTGEATEKQIEKAKGGILFIDEAYMLYKKEGTNDFGSEAIATIITEISDGDGDIAIMLAGYPKEMEELMKSNPGLKSRFQNYYHFNDFTPNELLEIALFAAKNKKVILSEDAQEKIKKVITKAFRKRDKSFGNARFVHSLIDEAKMNLGIRIVRNFEDSELNKELLSTIEIQDIKGFEKEPFSNNLKLDIDTILLKEALAELNLLIGLDEVKTDIQQLIRLTKYYKEINRDVLKAFSLHTVFLGNPGTGKTTIARIIGKVYKALGLLERGHLIEADGSSLIAGYIGQTALKTKELIKSAMGGVLFIDEAYAITEGSDKNNFGKKAVASLLKEMEDHRGEFCVIVAGYPSNMKEFIEANPGLKSRFDKTIHFKDFNESELWEILIGMLQQKGLTPNAEAEKKLKQYISKLYSTRNKFFGNARSMRKIAEKTIRNQELRMAGLSKKERTKTMIKTIALNDVSEFTIDKIEISQRVKIGYHI